jgi:hypothetical protein
MIASASGRTEVGLVAALKKAEPIAKRVPERALSYLAAGGVSSTRNQNYLFSPDVVATARFSDRAW